VSAAVSTIDALFEPVRIGGLALPNRVVMSPMTRSFSGDAGVPGLDVARYYAARAAAGTGLIFTEGTVVDMGPARGYVGVPGLCNDAQEAAWRQVVDAVHAAGGRIMVQLWHCGRLSHPRATGGAQPLAPSAVTAGGVYVDAADPSTFDGHLSYVEPKAMDAADIASVTAAFAAAAGRAKRAGFDGVLFHGASGYLLHEYFNADSNQRSDDYNGDAFARARFAAEIVAATRREVGAGFPLLMGLSQFAVNDFAWQTWREPQALSATLGALAAAGIDGYHVAAYRIGVPAFAPDVDPDQRSLAWHVRTLSGLPVSAAGGVTYSTGVGESLMGVDSQLTDPAEAARALRSGDADLIAVGRAMLANPDWTAKVRDGRWQELAPFRREMLGELV
jgi:2,4-dienoyl-CoA reductase-like NADH-dependent reductase (Old Yellow Enzyme family)